LSKIHPTALVDPSAQLGRDVEVGAYAIIEADVTIGDECRIAAHAIIKRYTMMGARNQVFEQAVIGGDPQDLSFKPCLSRVEIGSDNIFREGVTIHRGNREGGVTRIGNSVFLMAYAHVAHDCSVGDLSIFANGGTLAGHVAVGERVFISGYSAIHQFCRIGRLAMISGLVGVNQDILPFTMTAGHPGRPCGVNRIGLRRAGMTAAQIDEIKDAYRRLFQSELSVTDAVAELKQSDSALVREWVEFIESSRRGFARERE
jgi:UDP-N-acetylglucosamine acyltransferase